MVRFHSLLSSAPKRLIERIQKSLAIVALTALVAANVQFEVQKFTVLQANAQEATQCNDGVDNDGDGMFDMADAGCTDMGDNSEFNVAVDTGNDQDQGGMDQQDNGQMDVMVPAAQCSDTVDNDGDGMTDMADAGCTSPNDNDEWNFIQTSSAAPQAACSDGIDNDGDGQTDMNDPGCTNPDDDNEFNPPASSAAPAACNDGIDNDNDNRVDMNDPGCTSPSDNDEWNFVPTSSATSSIIVVTTSQCNDTVDNDGDGRVDYPADPGCASPADNDEFNIIASSSSATSVRLPQCRDSVDNDGDGRVDYPADLGCTGPNDDDEFNIYSSSATSTMSQASSTARLPQCRDSVDNDGDGRVDYPADAGCTSPNDDDEFNIYSSSAQSSTARLPQCRDSVDNDGDGRVDYPADAGCTNPDDDDEFNIYSSSSFASSTGRLPQCRDSVDNDGDGRVDYPADLGCTNPDDDDEFNIYSSSSAMSSVASSTTSSTPNNGSDLRISKSGPTTVLRGNAIAYTLTVTNDGPATAQNVIVTDAFPNGFIYNDNASDSRCNLEVGQVRCSLGSMNVGTQSLVLSFSVPNINPCSPENVYNTAYVSISNGDTNLNNNTSNTVVTNVICPVVSSSSSSVSSSSSASSIPGNPDLSITKSGPATAGYNSTVVYTLTVTNSGQGTAQNVIVTDAFPSGFIYNDSASDSRCNLEVGQVRCYLGSMNPGSQSISLSFQTRNVMNPCFPENVYNTAYVSTSSNDANLNNHTSNTVITTLNCPNSSSSSSMSSSSSSTANNTVDVAITKTANPQTVTVGASTVFTVTVTNNGPAAAQNVIVTDVLPSGLTFINVFTTNGTYANGQWSIGTMQAGATAQMQIGATVNVAGTVINTATVTSANPDSNLGNNTASASVTGIQQTQTGCIEILKQTYSANGSPFSTIAPFIFNLDGNSMSTTNDSTGHARFNNVTVGIHSVSEVVVPGWTLMSVFPQNGTVTVFASENNTSCSTVTFQNKLNSVSSSSSSSSSVPSNNADMAITKTANPSTVSIGAQTVFTVTVQNNGPATAQNVIVTDNLPSGLTFVNVVTTSGTFSNGQWNLGTMSVGASATMQLTARMNVNGSVTNTATVTSSTQDPNTGNNSASATVSGSAQTGCIDIFKTATDYNGNPIYNVPSFTFSLDGNRTTTNNSAGHAHFDNVPSGTHTVTEYGMNGWRIQSISPSNGQVTVNSNDTCAKVFIQNRETHHDNDHERFTISKTDGRSTVRPGDRLTYTITVRNQSGNSTTATVRDILPNDLRIISVGDSGRVNGRTVTWNNVHFSSFDTRTFRLTVEVEHDARGTITNRAEVNGRTATDTDYVDEDGTSNANLDLTKDASTYEVFPGGMVEYTVRFRNNSDDTLRNVRVTDILPANVTVIDDGNADNYSNGRLVWNIGSLSPNASRTIRYRITIGNSYTAGQFVRNDVEVTGDNGLRERASAVVQVIGAGNLPQTGFGDLAGSVLTLRPITGSANNSLPLSFWLALAGLTTGTGAGFLRKFITGV
ncbi:DUF11 domain-containing protein [Candidatus Peribacteria bacterium]|nr:MAG: DUF11 domain-containing protein [Candidatus Peribacteria bacterium]